MTKANKKGFTLVELIIVIAILAILIAALVPALVKYIEKSRVSKDKSSLDNVNTALKTALANEEIYGYNTADTWKKLSELTSSSTGKELALYNEIFNGTDATISTKYATNPGDIFKSSDAEDKVVWFAVTTGGKVLVCLAPDATGNTDAKIATKIGFIGEADPADLNW